MAYTTIDNPELYFQVKLYTGNGSTQTITLDNTDADLDPDLIWVKKRSGSHDSVVVDTVRGVTKVIETSTTDAEATWANGITAISTDSFAVGDAGATNDNTETFVAWCWKESADAGFDIVTYTGNGNTSRTISHSLSAVPHVMTIKERASGTSGWITYHHKNTSAPETDYLMLNTNSATDDYADYWDDTAPTSSVFTVDNAADINGNTDTYVAYLWAEKQGFSKFNSYIGNSNANGAFIYLGFRPAFIMIKRTNGTQWWIMKDNKRDGVGGGNPNKYLLYPNASDAEETNSNAMDFLSNGFKFRESTSGGNNSGGTYIYMAFAEAPFVNSNGVPCNAR